MVATPAPGAQNPAYRPTPRTTPPDLGNALWSRPWCTLRGANVRRHRERPSTAPRVRSSVCADGSAGPAASSKRLSAASSEQSSPLWVEAHLDGMDRFPAGSMTRSLHVPSGIVEPRPREVQAVSPYALRTR